MDIYEKIRLIADGEFEVCAKLSVDEITHLCRELRGKRYSLDVVSQERDEALAKLAAMESKNEIKPALIPIFNENDLIEIASSYSAYSGLDSSFYLNGWIDSGEAKGFIDLINDRSAPSHSQQSAPWLKDHQIAEIINSVSDVARHYCRTQQLRERIAGVLRPVLCGYGDRCPSHESEQS